MSDTVRRNKEYPNGYVRNIYVCKRAKGNSKLYRIPRGVKRFVITKSSGYVRVKRLNCNALQK